MPDDRGQIAAHGADRQKYGATDYVNRPTSLSSHDAAPFWEPNKASAVDRWPTGGLGTLSPGTEGPPNPGSTN